MCRRRGASLPAFRLSICARPSGRGRTRASFLRDRWKKGGGRRFSPGGFWGCSGVRWVDFFTKSSICICRFGIFVYLCTRLQVGRVLLVPAVQGSLAQLVQSVCLTSRGSGVRIPQLPQFSPQGAGKDGKRRGGESKDPRKENKVFPFSKKRHIDLIGSLAQLVQSVCLTSRGSGVRIPQLPQFSRKGREGRKEKRGESREKDAESKAPGKEEHRKEASGKRVAESKAQEGDENTLFRKKRHIDLIGSLAQLVQSVCLTSRGSGVRIPQLPQAAKSRSRWLRDFFYGLLCPRRFFASGVFFAMLFPLEKFCLDAHSPALSNLWVRAFRRLFFLCRPLGVFPCKTSVL